MKKMLLLLLILITLVSCNKSPQRIYHFGEIAKYDSCNISIKQNKENEEFIVSIDKINNPLLFDFKIYNNANSSMLGEGFLIYYINGNETTIDKNYYINDDCTIVVNYSSISDDDKKIISINEYYVEVFNYSWYQ